MLKRYFAPLLLASLAMSGCQSSPEGKFTPEQIAAMKSYGFNELNGDLTDVPASDTPETARQRSQSITIKTTRLTPITGNASPSRRLIRNVTPLPHSGNASQL